jgi:hypothetical protein
MSAHANPNIITDNLVFGYDTGYNINDRNLGVGRHFKGPISNNLLEVHNHSRSNTSGTNGFVLNGEETVNIPKIGKRSVKYVEYYNNYNNSGDLGCCPNLFYYHNGYITGVESSTSYTYSIIYKHTGDYTHPNFMYRYEYQSDGTYNTEGGIHSTASNRRRHLGNGWYHAWGTFTTQSTTTQLRCYSFLYNYGTTKHRFYVASISLIKNISGSTHLITPPRLILKPNTSVSSTQSIIDLKRTTSIDVSNVSFDSNAQMTFDGTDDYIALPSDIRSIFTSYPNCMECILKKSSSNQGDMVAFDVDITRWNLNYNMYVSNQWSFDFYDGTEHVIAAGNYDDEYVHFVLQQLSDGTMQIYANGVLKGSSAASNLAPNGSSIRIGSRSNGDSRYFNGYIPIMKIYNRALTSAEVASNFTAYKSRFQL